LEIFSDIEVANLALMQQSQATEGSLEILKTKLRKIHATNDAEIASLHSQLDVSKKREKKSRKSINLVLGGKKGH
jgi:hypothetical protein